ncbi:uncharacterized protein EDB93DRAFT_1100220 [Suillus bovinus]|uniref:uncharacterized protein n=1 Tax=Suillus bovinus TaxID=48563 RepID=UPI001B8838AA|nr:uncharacterized protein EDB93DRAFT_1100220 [Suillus bovinus]KAG2158538.1 hypothetical protein EDB93DRAFT_1100220 [Suillus bovinus]
MTFEDYVQILARPCKPKVKPTVDSVLSDTQLKSNCAPAASATDDEDDGMGDIGNNDDHDKNPNEGNDQADEDKEKEGEDEENKDRENQDSGCAKTSPDNLESDNNAKDTNEEPDDDENNEDRGCTKTLPVRRLWARKVKMVNYNFDDSSPTFSSDSSYTSSHAKREHPARSNQVSAHESDADEDLNHDSPSSPPAKRRKTSSAVNTTSANTTRSTTIGNKHSVDDHTPAGIVIGPTPDNEPTENEEELPGNLNPRFYCVNGTNSRVSAIVDWKERQRTHYHVMGKDNEQWDTIRKYSITGGNIDQSRAKTILSMREDIARKLSTYSHLEGVEAIGCIFDTTQDEAAQQVSGFVAGSDLIVKLINEHQLDTRAILDWVVMATKRIWPIMVLEKTYSEVWLSTQSSPVYKFMIKNWRDDITPIGPKFNPHNLSSQHLKLLVIPFIKCKAHSYYKAELQTEAENLFEIEKKKSKGKRRGQEHTVEDVMSELDVDAPEIEFAAWPDECLKQLSDEVPEMFDIPLVTSTLDVVLRKLADSAKFKASIPEDMLVVHEAHSHGPIPSTAEMLPGGHESSSPTLSSPALPSNQHHTTTAMPVRHREGSHPTQLPDLLDHEYHPVRPTTRGELTGGGPRQANMPFKVKNTLQVEPTLVRRMEEHPTRSHNATDLEYEPYPHHEDRNFIASNRRQEYSLSPPVYPERAESSHARPRETTPSADNGDYSHPQHHYSCHHNWDDDQSQRFQVIRLSALVEPSVILQCYVFTGLILTSGNTKGATYMVLICWLELSLAAYDVQKTKYFNTSNYKLGWSVIVILVGEKAQMTPERYHLKLRLAPTCISSPLIPPLERMIPGPEEYL